MDVVVTVPQSFGLQAWIAEGQLPNEAWNGKSYGFSVGRRIPDINIGERVYIVYQGLLRGFAPLVACRMSRRGVVLVRQGGAVAVTIEGTIQGFRSFRYRWWSREVERPFPNWQQESSVPVRRLHRIRPAGVVARVADPTPQAQGGGRLNEQL